MDFNRFTEKLQEAVRAAQGKAVRYGNQQIDVEHLLVALLEQEGGLASSILTRAGVNVEALSKKLTSELERLPKVSGTAAGVDQIYVTPRLNKLLSAAEDEAAKLKDEYISVEHVLLAAVDHEGSRGDARAADAGAARGAGQPAGDVAESGSHLRGAGKVRARPDEAGVDGQAGSGDRARRRDPPRDPGALAADEEQSGADRRAGRGKDGDRRGAGAAHRARRRAGGAEEQEGGVARHGRADRGREVSRRVRRAAEGGAEGSAVGGGRDHSVYRRTAHGGGRGEGRRLDGRGQSAEADAGARRTALHRRDHAGRVSQVHREGRGAGAAFPDRCWWTSRRWRTRSRFCAG